MEKFGGGRPERETTPWFGLATILPPSAQVIGLPRGRTMSRSLQSTYGRAALPLFLLLSMVLWLRKNSQFTRSRINDFFLNSCRPY